MARHLRREPTVTLSVRLPADIHAAIQACAYPIGQSLNQFVVQACSTRVMNWRHPVSGEKPIRAAHRSSLAGWLCYHGTHGEPVAAMDCPHGANANHRRSWEHGEIKVGFDEWAATVELDVAAALSAPTGEKIVRNAKDRQGRRSRPQGRKAR